MQSGRYADVVLECAGAAAVSEGIAMAATGGRYLAQDQSTDRRPTLHNPYGITRKELTVFGSWGVAEKHFQGHPPALPNLMRRFDIERVVCDYPLTGANRALADLVTGCVMKPLLVPYGASA
jgi:threonine dehydrogenase-like Zn-dependent dehydrogenase